MCSIEYQLILPLFFSLLQAIIDHRFKHLHIVHHHLIILQRHLHTVLLLRNIQHIILQAHQAILHHRQNIPQSKSNQSFMSITVNLIKLYEFAALQVILLQVHRIVHRHNIHRQVHKLIIRQYHQIIQVLPAVLHILQLIHRAQDIHHHHLFMKRIINLFTHHQAHIHQPVHHTVNMMINK